MDRLALGAVLDDALLCRIAEHTCVQRLRIKAGRLRVLIDMLAQILRGYIALIAIEALREGP